MTTIKAFLVFAIAITITSVANAQNRPAQKDTMQHKTTQAPKKLYTCPMHPGVVSDKPGKCPKCGMDLVEKKMPAGKKNKKDTAEMKM